MTMAEDRFGTRSELPGGVAYYRLDALAQRGVGDVSRLPMTVRILLENLLRHVGDRFVTDDDVAALAGWDGRPAEHDRERAFVPARVLLQDFTGVPAVVDLAAMRSAVQRRGGDPGRIDPLVPVDLVVDHSVQVDAFGSPDAYGRNIEREYERNHERYALLRWAQQAFHGFRVVPPGMGIVHQVNLEYLAETVTVREVDGVRTALPDTVVGTDSHTPMVNGVGVLGWGVGGIEAEACMLGQPLFLLTPVVVGVRFHNALPAGTTATDLVLTLTEKLRRHGVVNKFVEFCGSGLSSMPVPDRATLSNMSPEFGATASLFPVDDQTLRYLRETGRDPAHVELVERYCREQGLFRTDEFPVPVFTELLELDLASVEPSVAGPRRPQDRVPLAQVRRSFEAVHGGADATVAGKDEPARLVGEGGNPARAAGNPDTGGHVAEGAPRPGAAPRRLDNGSVVIAAITSCTNTSNPSVMVAAGLLAQRAVERGLRPPDYVKTSLAPGSRVVTDYLERAGLLEPLDRLGFNLVGYGCTTCIGNSGPLPAEVAADVESRDLAVCAVLSGNRNFEGRIHPQVRASYLASPPLVVAFALAGTVEVDLTGEPVGTGSDGRPVFLRELWPSSEEIAAAVARGVGSDLFGREYSRIFEGDEHWRELPSPAGAMFVWDPDFDLRARAGLLRGHGGRAAAAPGHPGCPGPRPARRFDHHRPHLPGGEHRPRLAGGGIPAGARGRASRFQHLRRPAGQSRGHGPGHFRQHPAPQPARRGARGRLHHPPRLRRGDEHLRRRRALRGRGDAAHRGRRQGVRLRVLPRLGRQGAGAAGGAGGDRPVLRADPPQQPGGDGHPAASVRGGGERREPGS